MNPLSLPRLLLLCAALGMAACSGGKDPKAVNADAPAAAPEDDAPLPPLAYESALPEDIRDNLNKTFTGDLEEMVKRRIVRVGVTFNRTHYFVDKGLQRGVSFEYIKLMEDELNKRRKTGNLKVMFWPIPLPREQLLAGTGRRQARHRDRADHRHAGTQGTRRLHQPDPRERE